MVASLRRLSPIIPIDLPQTSIQERLMGIPSHFDSKGDAMG